MHRINSNIFISVICFFLLLEQPYLLRHRQSFAAHCKSKSWTTMMSDCQLIELRITHTVFTDNDQWHDIEVAIDQCSLTSWRCHLKYPTFHMCGTRLPLDRPKCTCSFTWNWSCMLLIDTSRFNDAFLHFSTLGFQGRIDWTFYWLRKSLTFGGRQICNQQAA